MRKKEDKPQPGKRKQRRRLAIGEAGKLLRQSISQRNHNTTKHTRTPNKSSKIEPGLNQMQQCLHRSIIIRDITRVHLEKWCRLLEEAPKRLIPTMQLRKLLHHVRVENQQLLNIAKNLLEKRVRQRRVHRFSSLRYLQFPPPQGIDEHLGQHRHLLHKGLL